ncbi:hypothetical protein DYBT9275_03253 [Dyadobacter sp. CECT 9275]|uniref:Uncharacterized protein n=1 Tax=Dyadobacter helix TaxID=2822344 RepID=A0A916JEK1_9BACT|nr:hypothetical protein [Dyadobacter sp. CECT 9275]CAG5003896.1 hypothetical protein DYBT9275_03253 [Dyadobacter sp. CECT 9275]
MKPRQGYRRNFRAFPLFFIAALLALGAIVRLLWNAVLPAIAPVNSISYWQAVGLLALCRILFGNFGNRMGPGAGWRGGPWQRDRLGGDHPGFGGARWRKKWMTMSDEERKKFREEIRDRCRKRPE